jgi:hypothetical protein
MDPFRISQLQFFFALNLLLESNMIDELEHEDPYLRFDGGNRSSSSTRAKKAMLTVAIRV